METIAVAREKAPTLDQSLETVCIVLGGSGGERVSELLAETDFPLSYVTWDEFRSLFRTNLRSLRKRIVGRQLLVYVVNPNTRPLLNHFLIIATMLGPERTLVFEPGQPLEVVRLQHTVGAICKIGWATVVALWELGLFWGRLFVRIALRQVGVRAVDTIALDTRTVVYMKTSYSFSELKAGGSITHTAGVVNALAKLGFNTVFVSADLFGHLSGLVQVETIERPPVAPVPTSWYGLLLARRMAKHVTHSDTFRKKKLAVYQRLVPFNAAGLEVAQRLGVPWVVEYNGSEAWISRHWGRGGLLLGILAAFERAVLRATDRIVVVSEVLKEELLHLGIPEERIRMYPNCVDPTFYTPKKFDERTVHKLRTELGISDAAVLCTFIGTFGRWHGAEVLAEAIASWYADDPEYLRAHRVVFLFVGDGLMMPEVRRRLGTLVNSDFVSFAGMVPQGDSAKYLAASGILLSPHVANADGSLFFGSPTKLFEYMAMAKPIVASDLEQIGQILRPALCATDLPACGTEPAESDSRVAILCRPGVPEDIRGSIEFLIDNPAWCAALGRRARERILERYTWEHHVRATLFD